MAHIWCALAPLAYCPRRTGAMCHHSFVVKGRFATERTLTSNKPNAISILLSTPRTKAGSVLLQTLVVVAHPQSTAAGKAQYHSSIDNNKGRQARHTHVGVRLHRLFSYSCNNALRNIAEGEPKRVFLSFYIPSFYHQQHHVNKNNNKNNNARRCRGTPVPAAATSSPPASDNTCCSRQSRGVWCHHGTLQDRSSSLSMEEEWRRISSSIVAC